MKIALAAIVFSLLTFLTFHVTSPSLVTDDFASKAPNFYVLGEKSGAYAMLKLSDITDSTKGYTFRLDESRVSLDVGDVHNIQLLSSNEKEQTIAFGYIDTYSSTSIYKVVNNRVEPVSYKINNHMGQMFFVFFMLLPTWLITNILWRIYVKTRRSGDSELTPER